MPLRLLFPIGVQKPEKSTFVKKCKQFSEKGKASDFLFQTILAFQTKRKCQVFLITAAAHHYSSRPNSITGSPFTNFIVIFAIIIKVELLPSLCDDQKLFESTKRVIWGTACEQQHKSVPILYLMVITMKHRKNAKKCGF